MVADNEELEQMDASEIHARRLNAKEVLPPMKGDNFKIPSRRLNSQNLWRRSTSENIHLNLGWPGGCRSRTGGGGLVRVPNLRVCRTPWWEWHMQGVKGE